MGKTVIDYDPCVPTDSHPDGMALWWLPINIGTERETYTSFMCRPTQRQIRSSNLRDINKLGRLEASIAFCFVKFTHT